MEMTFRDNKFGDQLSLDFSANVTTDVSDGSLSSDCQNVVCFKEAFKVRAESEKEEILNLFSEYAKKLKW